MSLPHPTESFLRGLSNITITEHTNKVVRSVCFSPDGKHFATGSDDKTARIWDVGTGTVITTLTGHTSTVNSVCFSPDSAHIATGGGDHETRIWDVGTGTVKTTLTGHTKAVTSVCFSPDGKHIATGSDDGSPRIWDMGTGTVITTLKGLLFTSVYSVCFSPDSLFIATGSEDHTTRIWEVGTGTEIALLTENTGTVYSVCFSPDGKLIATGSVDHLARIWDVGTGDVFKALEGHTGEVYSVCFSPDGKHIATGSGDNTARIWDVGTGTVITTLTGHTSTVTSVSYSPDGILIATGSYDKTARIWEVGTGTVISILVDIAIQVQILKHFEEESRKTFTSTATGATSPYHFELSPGPWKDSLEFISQCPAEHRVSVFDEWCTLLPSLHATHNLPPHPDSITLCPDAIKSAAIKQALEDALGHPAPRDLLDSALVVDVEKQAKVIEDCTGHNPLTKQTDLVYELIISGSEYDVRLVAEHGDAIKAELKFDIANAFSIPPDQVVIRRLIHGSVEVLFSIPSSVPTAAVRGSGSGGVAPIRFNELMKTLKYPPSTTNAPCKLVAGGALNAINMLKQYVRPLVINTTSSDSTLIKKFKPYLPVLASLSTHVRVHYDEIVDEIHVYGRPEQKAEILRYFAELENLLTYSTTPATVTIIEMPPAVPTGTRYPQLWDVLYQHAKAYALKEGIIINDNDKCLPLQTNTLMKNPELDKDCPSGRKFLAALNNMGLDPAKPDDVLNHGLFGWHGTRSDEAIVSIAHDNLDPGRRSVNIFGPGEYCAVDVNYSLHKDYSGKTSTLFVFFILSKSKYYKFSTHHVINNPSSTEMYMVPVLIATFGTRTPITITCPCGPCPTPTSTSYLWEWFDDYDWVEYGYGQPIDVRRQCQVAIEHQYQNAHIGACPFEFTLSFVRLNDQRTQDYLLNCKIMKQKNVSSKFFRDMRRRKLEQPEPERREQERPTA